MSSIPSIKRSVSKTIDAPPEKVFDSWLIPAVVGRWMFGREVQAESVIELVNNVRPRGDFTYTLRRAGKEVVITGIYLAVDRPRRLEFSWHEDGGVATLVQVLFEAEATRTKIRVSIKLDGTLAAHADTIKQRWATQCALLAQLLSKKS